MPGSTVAAKHSRVRQRKLNIKQALGVLAEEELDALEANELSQGLKELNTGVEAHEESELHLQAIIKANHAAASGAANAAVQAYIPTRGTSEAEFPYEPSYSLKFSQPATYIRFSSTVEDCIEGAAYDLLDEDEAFLKTLNQKLRAQAQNASSRPASRSASAAAENTPKQCTETQFEMVMEAFETAARVAAPFSNSVSGDKAPPVLTLDEQLAQFTSTLPEESILASPSAPHAQATLRALAPHVYPYWQSRRSQNENSPLIPPLKVKLLEPTDSSEDNDPYICFRRREQRQQRKTRNRDAQSAERLRRLRRELEEARALIAMVRQRELSRKEQLLSDRTLFEQRHSLRGVKRTLSEKIQDGDEDLLINQKPRVSKPLQQIRNPNSAGPGRNPSSARGDELERRSRESLLPGGTGPEMQLLSDWTHLREQRQVDEIKHKIAQHATWNESYVDMTKTPLSPLPLDDGLVGGFRAARTEYLPTPPASVDEEIRGLDESGKSGLDKPARVRVSDFGHQEGNGDIVMAGIGGPSPPAEKDSNTIVGPVITPELSQHESPGDTSERVAKVDQKAVVHHKALPVRVRYATPDSSDSAPTSRSPSFRRRMGRGGRLFIDRRHIPRMLSPDSASEAEEDDALVAALLQDRSKFDKDSDDDVDDDPGHVHKDVMDPYHWRSMLLRAQYSIGWQGQPASGAQQAQIERTKQGRIQGMPAQVNGSQSSPQTIRQQVAAQAAASK